MSSALKQRLAFEVARRESTLNDVAVGILADRFGVPFEPSGRKGAAPGESGVVLLRLPPELKRRIQSTAFDHESNTNRVILEALAEHLGVRLEPARGSRVPFGGGRRGETMAQANGRQNGGGRSEDKVRVAVIAIGLGLGSVGGLQWAIALLALTAWATAVQRILFVRKQLLQKR